MEDIVGTLKLEISTLKDVVFQLEAYLKAKVACLQSLEQQLAVIEAEKARKVADVEEQAEANIFSPDPVKMALEIPLILETIFGKLDFTSLMGARSVAKYWNEAALNVFAKAPTNGGPSRGLNLEKFFKSSDFDMFPELEPKLAKRIFFTVDCNTSKQKFIIFCEKFSNQIQEMYFFMPSEFAPTIFKGITNRCPNLKSLHLSCNDPAGNEMEAMPHDELFRMNLKTIEFNNGGGHQQTRFYEQLQRIIDRAPNLAQLNILDNYYPNLTNNKNLKHLYFYGRVNKPNFDQTKLSEMLDQVKDSLEVLEIWTPGFARTNPQDFSFPSMKLLKKLSIFDLILHPLEQDGRNIIETIASKIPNLEHFGIYEIGNLDGKAAEMLLIKAMQGPPIQLFKIQTLILNIQSPFVLASFNLWFPNLKDLTLTMREEGEIKAVFSALGGLKLKHFYFAINFRFKFSNLVNALVAIANPELFEGLETLKICANFYDDETPFIVDDLQCETRQVFCEWLRSTVKNMKKVTFKHFLFCGESALEVISVIREHQLPVHFNNFNDLEILEYLH